MIVFYISAGIAALATLGVICLRQPMHALLCLIASLVSLSICMGLLGAPFSAALEIIVYAGAIMVLFVFVVMLLGLGDGPASDSRSLLKKWWLPVTLTACLSIELICALWVTSTTDSDFQLVSAKEVAHSLFQNYGSAVELVSFLLLAGLVGAYHICGSRKQMGDGAT